MVSEFHVSYLDCKLSNDPSLSSLPLLITFLKSYSRPFLGIVPPATLKQNPVAAEPGSLSAAQSNASDDGLHFPPIINEEEELIEPDIRDRFKRMCEGYYDNVCKKLVMEHKVIFDFDLQTLTFSLIVLLASARTRQAKP
jgi:regulator of nonsense transcripts 2